MAPSSLKLAIPLFASLLQASSIDECPMLSKRDDGVINNPPSNDAFYLPPPDFETSLPGDVLSIRQIGEKSSVMESMYQILYRTADTLGRPQAAVTTLWVPQNGTNNQLLSYQTPYDSVNSDCVPSFAVRDASTPVSIGPVDSYDVATINAALANGWYVSMPDYFGPQAAFASGPQAAKATLDGIRAVLQSSDCTGISPDAKVAMYGHSVGAHATEWAAEYKQSYAPELDVVGAAVAGLAPRLTTILSDTNDGPYASYGPAILLGLSNAYPTVKQWLYETLVPATADYFFDLEHVCGSTAFFERFAAQDFTSYFADGLQAFDDPRYLAAIGNAGIMGRRGPPAMPLLVVDATNDHVSSIGDTVELVSTYCSKGGSVDFVESTTGGHLQAVEAAADAAMTWLDLAFAGESHTKGCRRWNLTGSAIEPLSAPASSTALPSTTSSSAEYSSTKSSMTSASTRTMAQTEISVPASSSSDSTTTITRTAAELTTTVKSIIRRPAPSLSSSRRATTLTSTVDAQPTGSSSSRRTTTITSTVAAQTPDTSSSRRTTTITFTNEAALPSLSSSRRTTTLTSTVEAPSSSESKKRRTTTLTRTVEPLPAPTNLETRMPLSVSRTVSPLPNVRAMTSSPIVVSPRPTPQVTTMVSCKTLTSTLPYMTVSCQTKLVNGPVSGAFKPHAVIGSWALDFLVITVTALAFSLA